MTPQILDWIQDVKYRLIPASGRVLEVGSYDVNGSPRGIFADATEYLGIDGREGPGVDQVADANTLDLGKQYDLVICCEMLEHDPNPLLSAENLRRHVRPGGLLLVTTPANGFPDHKYPKDFWRIMPDAMQEIVFAGFEVLEMATVTGPTLCAIGRKP